MTPQSHKDTKARGQGLVEFALILPILLLIIFGIIDMGRVIVTYAMASNNLRDALRQAEVLGYQGLEPPYANCGAMRGQLQKIFFIPVEDGDYTITYYNHATYDAVTQAMTAYGNCNTSSTATFGAWNDLVNGDVLRITLDTSVPLLTPGISMILPEFPITFVGQRTIITTIPLQGDPEDCLKVVDLLPPFGVEDVDVDNDGANDYEDENGDGHNDCDTDYDGLDDWWEEKWFGNNDGQLLDSSGNVNANELQQTGTGDPDGDGCNNGCEETRGTDPKTPGSNDDTDGDGINDGDESYYWYTDPNNRDTDGDGIWDGEEIVTGADGYITKPKDDDTDDDGLLDGEETAGFLMPDGTTVYTDPTKVDTDGDTISDYDEVKTHLTDPTKIDTDGDTIGDLAELNGDNGYVTDPTKADTDSDGLNDNVEVDDWGTSPIDNDSDNDSILDGTEVNGWNITVNGSSTTVTSDPLSMQSDVDGLNDGGEKDGFSIHITIHNDDTVVTDEDRTIYTNPKSADTDGDGIDDNVEISGSNGYVTDPSVADTDGDGVDDGEEIANGDDGAITNPLNSDTDGDGTNDGEDPDPAGDDEDGDGLGDLWEDKWFGNKDGNATPEELEVTDKFGDQDGDGCNNQCEQQYNLNPHQSDFDGDGLTDGQEVHTYTTNPKAQDSDTDGLWDGAEVNTHNTNPNYFDSDNDGLSDGEEVNPGTDGYTTNPNDDDSDDDGLKDGQELVHTLNPNDSDWDDDGLTDGQEVNGYKGYTSDPKNQHSDGDGINDYLEVENYGTNPRLTDTDEDNLDDDDEITLGTNPLNPHSDGDNVKDGDEVIGESISFVTEAGGSQTRSVNSNPLDTNSDGDGLDDNAEYSRGTDPEADDTDDDRLSDSQEVNGFVSPKDGKTYTTNPLHWDTDDDELSDYDETHVYGTDPTDPDTDNDGIPDGDDIANGSCAAIPPRLSIKDASIREPQPDNQGGGKRNTTTVEVEVELECGNAGQTVRVNATVVTSGGGATTTAVAGEDYDAFLLSGDTALSLTPPNGSTTATDTIEMTVKGDLKPTGSNNGEDDGSNACTQQYVVIQIYGQTPNPPVTISDGYGVVTIRNDDCPS